MILIWSAIRQILELNRLGRPTPCPVQEFLCGDNRHAVVPALQNSSGRPCPELLVLVRFCTSVLRETLTSHWPERWVDLIHYLNEQERTALITKPPSKSVQES
jgi:glutaredoxin 2